MTAPGTEKTEELKSCQGGKSSDGQNSKDSKDKDSKIQNMDMHAFLSKHFRTSSAVNDRHIKYSADELSTLIMKSITIFKAESTLAEMRPPCVIVGDIHGQFYDLLRMFSTFDRGSSHGSMRQKFLFLGDYVDRGRRSLECICLVLALKITHPKKYQVLRGNHECKAINRVYGFYDEILDRFDKPEAERLWNGFNEVFAWMPLAGLVGGQILCMHGGISPHLNSLDDIRNIKRPIDDPAPHPLSMDLLWADPMSNVSGYQPNTVRAVSVFFGEDTVQPLLKKLGISLVVRAHQMMLSGYGFFANRKVITIFTAPRYQPDQNNNGAVLIVAPDGGMGFGILAPDDKNIDHQVETRSAVYVAAYDSGKEKKENSTQPASDSSTNRMNRTSPTQKEAPSETKSKAKSGKEKNGKKK